MDSVDNAVFIISDLVCDRFYLISQKTFRILSLSLLEFQNDILGCLDEDVIY